MLLAGCVLPEQELQLQEQKAVSGELAFLWQGAGVIYAEVYQGNPSWGIPARVVFPENGRVVEFAGRYRAFLEADSLLWLLVEERERSFWVGITPSGQQRVEPALTVPLRWGLRPCGVLRSGLWAFHGQGELWLFEPRSGRWERRVERLLSVAFEPTRRELVWLESQGERVVLTALGPEGRMHRRSVLDSLPASPEKVVPLIDSAGVALCWLRQGRRGWELWWRRGTEERRVLGSVGRAEPSLQSLGRQWILVTSEGLLIGDGSGVRARGDGVGSSGLRVRQLATGEVVGTDGQYLWRWSLRPVPWWRWGLVGGIGVLGVAALGMGIAFGGTRLWRSIQRAMVRRLLHSGATPGWVLDNSHVPRTLPAELRELWEKLRSERKQKPHLVRAQGKWWIVLPLASSHYWVQEVTETVEEQQFELAQNVSHEFRTELNRLRERLCEWFETEQNAGAQPGASTTLDSRSRLRELLRPLERRLDIARRLAEPPQREVVRLEDLWGCLCEAFPELVTRGVLVCQPLVPSQIALRGDSSWLSDALFNAVENAWRALSSGGQLREGAQIQVRAFREVRREPGGRVSRWVVIEVVDNGPGIPSQTKGGLGMRIMRKVAQEFGGQVRWDSAPEGGTRVRFWLPEARGDGRRDT